MLVSAGSGLMTAGISASAGVTDGAVKDTLMAPYNDLEVVHQLFEINKNKIAAVIIEPVAANMGIVLPRAGFLEGLRTLCDQYGALLIFDEVITGFRLGLGGAQARFGIRPDLTTFGKIIGGGMPVGAYGGRRDLMEQVAPLGKVYQAGTLSGNPIAMAAGLAQLTYLKDHPDVYAHLETMGERLFGGIRKLIDEFNMPCTINHIGSLGSLFFAPGPIEDYQSAKRADTAEYACYFKHMLAQGFYLAPAQFEAMFISNAHSIHQIDMTLHEIRNYFMNIREK
jgi:glutamate-1-semialdehyde 2,1-aminomutase